MNELYSIGDVARRTGLSVSAIPFSTEQGRLIASPEMTARIERHRQLVLEAQAYQQAGVPADSPQARDIAERVVADSARLITAMTGDHGHDVERARRGIVDFDPNGRSAQTLAKSTGLQLLTRYHSLVATIDGTPKPDPERAAAVREWLAAALRGSPSAG
ncbi:hypothetical protein [Streptomyces sp. NPDC001100]